MSMIIICQDCNDEFISYQELKEHKKLHTWLTEPLEEDDENP